MVPGYDDPVLWEGHASMVHEIQRQLPDRTRPHAIFCSLGGGGLAGGIIEGCRAVGWDDGEPLFTYARHTTCAHIPASAACRRRNAWLKLLLPVAISKRRAVRGRSSFAGYLRRHQSGEEPRAWRERRSPFVVAIESDVSWGVLAFRGSRQEDAGKERRREERVRPRRDGDAGCSQLRRHVSSWKLFRGLGMLSPP